MKKLISILLSIISCIYLVSGGADITGDVNITQEYQINGTSINTGGTLSNVCYLDYNNSGNLNLTGNLSIDTWLGSTGDIGLDLTDDGSDITLHAGVGGVNNWYFATDGAFMGLVANPGPANGYLMWQVEETQGNPTNVNIYEGGTGHNRFWSSGSVRIGGSESYLCSNLTSDVDCDTPGTGADLVVQDDIWAGGDIIGNLTGTVTGNSDTATALAANGANCAAGSYPLGVDANGAVESCTDATTEIDAAIATKDECNEITNCVPNAFDALSDFATSLTDEYLCSYESTTGGFVCDIPQSTFLTASPFGASIDDTEMTAENFGEFTCTGAEDGCTLNSGVYDDEYIELGDTFSNSGGEATITGSYNSLVITLDNNALDDQYYDSEADLTALLDDNYEGELNNEAGLYAALSDVSEFIETNDNATLSALNATQYYIGGCIETWNGTCSIKTCPTTTFIVC